MPPIPAAVPDPPASPLPGPRRPVPDLRGKLRSVERMDEIDPADQVPDLVALQLTDEMPPNLRSKLLILRHGLLDPVFSEIPLSRRDRLADERYGMGLAHGHERDAPRVPSGALGGGVDPRPHTLEGGGDRAHRVPSTHVIRAWRS